MKDEFAQLIERRITNEKSPKVEQENREFGIKLSTR